MQALRHAQAADTHKNDGSSHQLFCPALPGQKTSLPALVGHPWDAALGLSRSCVLLPPLFPGRDLSSAFLWFGLFLEHGAAVLFMRFLCWKRDLEAYGLWID